MRPAPARWSVLTLATTLALAAGLAPATAAPRLPDNRDVSTLLFEWNWPSVARECRDFLGPAGFGAVQVSPPQEHAVFPEKGYPWWQAYQPVSYRLESRKGTREQFAAMVRDCHAAGVKVYVDVVVNHMTAQDEGGVGSGGTRYGHFSYPGLYGYEDFHHCGRNGNDDIADYNDRYQVQNCELLNLADLATEKDQVRDRIAGYLNDLISLGADGFRVDGAKHLPATDIGALRSRLSRPVYLYQEVIHAPSEPIQPEEYLPNGSVKEFRYGPEIGRVFRGGKLDWLRTFGSDWGFVPSDKAVTFTDNHDNQRSEPDRVLTNRDHGLYALANAFQLAWPYGQPRIMSSYAYANNDQGPPSDSAGRTRNSVCFDGNWVCEHRWQAIANMVGFRNATQGQPVTRWWSNGANLIAFGRGDRGYVVMNRESTTMDRSYQTGLPAGDYCDVIHGRVVDGACQGPTYHVDQGGWFRAKVAPTDAVALHAGARVGGGT